MVWQTVTPHNIANNPAVSASLQPESIASIMAAEQPEKIIVTCTSCNGKLRLAASSAGKRFKCPKCGEVNVVPAATGVTQPPPLPKPPQSELVIPLAGDENDYSSSSVPSSPPSFTPPSVAADKVHKTPKSKQRIKAVGAFTIGTCLSAAAALIGGTVWFCVSWYLEAEVGYIAWGVGILCGYAMHVAYRDQSVKGGVVSALMATAGIVGAKITLFLVAMSAILCGNTDNIELRREFVKVQTAYEILEQKGITDEAEWQAEYDSAYAEAERRVFPMSDDEINQQWQIYKDELDAEYGEEDAVANAHTEDEENHPISPEQLASESVTEQSDEDSGFGALAGFFFDTAFSLWDLLWFFLAISSAYRIGSGRFASSHD